VTDPILFFLAVATILATPGPTNTLMATSGATSGIARSWPLLIAEIAGYLIAILLIRAVLAPIVHAYPAIGIALKVAVALYLIWLATKLWRRPLALDTDTRSITFTNVFITTLLNPKALIFALTVFPQENSTALLWCFAAFAATVIAAGGGWIVFGRLLKGAAGSHAGLIPKIAAVAMVGFAGFILRAAI
jgi:threonine/homoserine/homoserine lactone efflux protein